MSYAHVNGVRLYYEEHAESLAGMDQMGPHLAEPMKQFGSPGRPPGGNTRLHALRRHHRARRARHGHPVP